ncbi:MAG: ASKHA domain-containing protein [Spirochaetales bacterium]|nr:ASKHA domain-containing protein [Spirochaetales bacterium]
MICSVCLHCGLCEGSESKKNISVLADFSGLENLKGDNSLPLNFVGIAFDIGTTSIAANLFTLKDGILVSSAGEENCQVEFGSDVVSRISFSSSPSGLEKLHKSILSQIEKISKKLILSSQNFFVENRRGRAVLKRIVISGNTAMESFVLGISAASLAQFPFSLPSKFGFSVQANELGAFETIPPDCDFYFAPTVESFVGGDMVCAMIACGFLEKDKNKFLADIGTNCELCVYSADSNKIFCASTSAGPAFEGYGIECGIPAQEGAISKIEILENKKIKSYVLGNGKAIGICGTGILSAVSEFLKSGIIDSFGSFVSEREKIILKDEIYICQKDIRNFQLAKSAVLSGLEILSEKSGCKSGTLYLAGGFGSLLDIKDACAVKMIPSFLSEKTFAAGNASLCGASILLLNLGLRKSACELAENSVHVDLAQDKSFEGLYIKNLNFK